MEENQPSMISRIFRFSLGTFECVCIGDGEWTYPTGHLFSNTSKETAAEVLRQHNLPTDQVTTPYTCLFINTGKHKVLVDVGAGGLPPTTGTLARNLKAVNIEPADIDTIIITHAHPDHIGGNLDPDGNPLYPNARYFIWKDEWDFWNSEAAQAKWERFTLFVRKNLDPVQGQLSFLDGEREIVPGIWAVAAPGHTPGHMALSIRSGREQLIHVSDTVLHPLHLEPRTGSRSSTFCLNRQPPANVAFLTGPLRRKRSSLPITSHRSRIWAISSRGAIVGSGGQFTAPVEHSFATPERSA